ncbi:MAG: hypothetical protein VKI42_01585, partial [Synechococcaceae cyanobacterium]|nr:hypothetical protein [Synechococcaceae cyanobacterium]
MGRLQYQPPAGANYSLARLIAGETDSYEASIAALIDQRSEPSHRVPGSEWLPSGRFARALGIGTATAGGNLA